MKYGVKGLIITLIMFNIFQKSAIRYNELIVALLLISATFLIGEVNRIGQVIILVIEAGLTLYGYHYIGLSNTVFCLLLFDICYYKLYSGFVFFSIALFWNNHLPHFEDYFLSFSLTAVIAYLLRKALDQETAYHKILDGERRIRYDLEITQNALLLSNQEIERLAEVKERNRIARDLHDTIGHSIAGILMQLQAAQKIMKRDYDKAEEMMSSCILKLQSALETVRDTVHNMYSHEKVGIECIQEIITQYKYCPVEASYRGDFSEATMKLIEALSYILKEALTNVAKHSDASRINVDFMITEKLMRMMIKDNGKGFTGTKEGLGIRSMKDRIKTVNGIFTMDGSNGTSIVCTIPLMKE